MEGSVDLGFIEKCESWLLTNKFFPSKLGGRPAWLDLERIPQTGEIKCADCDGALTYLCQVSISVVCDQSTSTSMLAVSSFPTDLRSIGRVRALLPSHHLYFHLYESKLLAPEFGQVSSSLVKYPPFAEQLRISFALCRNIKALRCQLPRRNAFYEYEPSSEDVKSVSIVFHTA